MSEWQSGEGRARLLTDLFVDTGDLAYIFNQGRCFEQNRRYEDAIGRFREYLIKSTKLSRDGKADAEKHIAACESYLRKAERDPVTVAEAEQPEPPPPPPEPPKKAETIPVAEPTHAAEPTEALVHPPQSAAKPTGAGLRIAGMVLGSVGAAALITGVVLNLKVNGMSEELEQPESYSRSTDSTREDYKTLGWIGYGVGTACVATGAVLYYLGWSKKGGSPLGVALVPAIAANMTGGAITGAF